MPRTKIDTSVLQAFLDAFSAHDVDAIMSFIAEDCIFDMPRGPAPGGTAERAAATPGRGGPSGAVPTAAPPPGPCCRQGR
jgi:hypothetical protein